MKWSLKKNFEYLVNGSSTNEDLSALNGTNVVQTIRVFEIFICRDAGASEMVPQKEF